ncbi:Uncharacterized protein OS=Singulisphaera acidiphila (strain ATCC BAA-1392 / DSM 18658 / VKM B-2454 / MOB10) GN=Sinac_5817 PE=4 SV=1 [Gemmata massiliana]|uniref:SGNH/GDSL hydrolase family protein n=1 Tax=Gemmata massiliana TaxID=1210884 RepID=A0A6P2D8P9_9BACT|nr:hypothetical protein [Gemmata massiliana]VTR97721.1 Uncharacterized protein OS=Singulisphaera acidiphila (strain ATCC BAA-1392 / DSM 18658 / VKM B-2454 / MOB10) GN=Sinac_5817 PE=4 SV=1 [Gemmata massiliana]
MAARDVKLTHLTFDWLKPLLTKRSRALATRGFARRGAVVAVVAGVLAFVAIQVVLSGASIVTHLIADPVYGDKERRLSRLERAAPTGAPRVILLGTSRTGYGFVAGRVQAAATEAGSPAVVFNFGVPGAGPITHLIYLKRLLADGHRPGLLILEVLPPLLVDLPDGPFEARMLKGDLLTRGEIEAVDRYAMPTERLRRQWRDAALSPLYEHRFKLVGRIFPSALPWQLRYDWGRTPDPNGWNASDVETVGDEQRQKGIAGATAEYRDLFKHELPAGPSVAALRDLLTLCRDEHIPVALVVFPEAITFRALYPASVESKLARFFAELTTEFGCSFTDARTWIADDVFLDNHHLLRTGATTFTDRLAEDVILPFLRARSSREGR